MTKTFKLLSRALIAASLLAIAACGGGSGAQTVENNNPNQGQGGNAGFIYGGPSPASEDIQNFKLNLYDKLVGDDRCGSCHVDGGQSPQFVRRDDVNLAYEIALPLVDLSNPAASRLVAKVGGGHNCWEADAGACAETMTTWIRNWAQVAGSISNTVILTPPETLKDVGAAKSFPATPDNFGPVHDLLQQYCGSCHASTTLNQQQPYLGEADIQIAYDAARSRINLDNPENSRLVVRQRFEFHNCWQGNCGASAQETEDRIRAFADSIAPIEVDPDLVISKAVNLAEDGIVASSGGRVENNVIALYQFKEGPGSSTAFDTSGVDPALHLTLDGPHSWLGAWGVKFNGGRAQGSTLASRKLYDALTASGEFSVEAWVVPENVTQDGPARIITYSGGDMTRNFTLGQTLYNYDFALRSSTGNDANGMPLLSTPDADEVLQATLQHVVLTYSPVAGRSIYVNGERVSNADPLEPGTLANWDPSFALALGAEVSGDDPWLGAVRLLAIHNRALAPEDIVANYEVGVGEKFYLLFSVSHLINMPDAFVVFEVQQFDDYGYLFNKPFFVSLDDDATPAAPFRLAGMRIGINGREADVGQAFANLDVTISNGNYVRAGVPLSSLGTIIPLDKGPEFDQFFLTFDQAGSSQYARVEAEPTPAAEPADIEGQAAIGLRHYEEINNTLAALTGIDRADPQVVEVFELVKQQMPTEENPLGFLAAHQMGITQLAVQYCNELVDDSGARAAYFTGFDFGANVNSAFDSPAKRSAVIDPLVARLLAHSFTTVPDTGPAALEDQPVAGEIEVELDQLIDEMTVNSCSSDCVTKTANTVKSVCAAAVGSAVMLLQ